LQFLFRRTARRDQGLDDGGAFDDLLDIIAGRSSGSRKTCNFVDAPEEIVQIAHDVLVGAHQEEPE